MSSRPANLCFGGPEYKTLYTVGKPRVCSIPLKVAGAVSIRKLATRAIGNEFSVTWPAPSTGFKLQVADFLGGEAIWSDVANPPHVTSGLNESTSLTTNAAGFFRLRLN